MLFYAHVGTCNLDVQEFQVVVPLSVVQPCFRWWFPFWWCSCARNKSTIDELMCLLLVYIICQLLTWMELVCASFWLL